MNQILLTILAYGYIFIVGFVFLVMVIQLLSFYAAGKITSSINDEFMSAFTLFGALFLLGVASTLVNALLSIFLAGALIPGIAAFIIYLFAMLYAVIRVYDLSAGKALLHLIISFVITAVVTGLLVYGGMTFLPKKEAVQLNLGPATSESASDTNTAITETPAVSENEGTPTEDLTGTEAGIGTGSTAETGTTTDTGTTTSTGPKLPSAATVSPTPCQTSSDCAGANEECLNGFCAVPDAQ